MGREEVPEGLDRDGETLEVVAALPALVSVTDQTPEARYPAFRAIMAGKKKPVTTWSLDDLGLSATEVGAAATAVRSAAPKPPRQAGSVRSISRRPTRTPSVSPCGTRSKPGRTTRRRQVAGRRRSVPPRRGR